MKLISWNVNGLRSVHRKNFLKWFESENADIVCLQEIKAGVSDIEEEDSFVNPAGHKSHWHFAREPGYSGLAMYSKVDPVAIRAGLGEWDFDCEGRWLEADFARVDLGPETRPETRPGLITVINSYWPNSQREHARLPFKLKFCAAAERRLETLRARGHMVLICGDFNIAHTEIDLKNPKANRDSAGFLPAERSWMDHFTGQLGWVDGFREFEKSGNHFTWWSYRPGVRERNIGWRLDYFFVNREFRSQLKAVEHLTDIKGSDHCPVRLTLHDV